MAIIDHGKVIALGTPAELVGSLGGDVVIELALSAGALDDAELQALDGVRTVRRAGAAILVGATEARRAVPALLELLRTRRATLAALATRQPSLEDVFLALTGRRLRDE